MWNGMASGMFASCPSCCSRVGLWFGADDGTNNPPVPHGGTKDRFFVLPSHNNLDTTRADDL